MKRVAIINYGLGNLRSVSNAFEFLGAAPFVAEAPETLKNADFAVLPGVGAFGDGMENLRGGGWIDAILEYAVEGKKPFLGICLGMQLLATTGTEHGNHEGLNLVPGAVVRLTAADKMTRIPHIGWNEVKTSPEARMYSGVPTPHDFYFVHSYVLAAYNKEVVSGRCHHGEDFAASVEQDNVWGVQFHPEKSQKAGLALLNNFLGM